MLAENFKKELSERREIVEEAIRVLREELDISTATSGVINQKIEQILGKFSIETDVLLKVYFAEMFDTEQTEQA